jgi:hypothetical protein
MKLQLSGVFCAVVLGSTVYAASPDHQVNIRLRGGVGHAAVDTLRRELSHEDIKSECHGQPDTPDARVFAKVDGEHRSLWHDLPLFEISPKDGKPTGALHFVCEIPKWTRFNPILFISTSKTYLTIDLLTGKSSSFRPKKR